MYNKSHIPSAACRMLALTLFTMTALPVAAFAQQDIIDAVVMGTSTQLGREVPVKVVINHYSTPQETQELINAFKQGQQAGLVNALSHMKPAGQLQIRGGVGYDIAYATSTPTPTGYRVRFITTRWVRFFEAFADTRSQTYNLTAGEFDINTRDQNKSSGAMYPASELVINREGQLEWQLFQNPWRVTDIIDWNAKKKG
jgi:hypothetical protein